MLPAGKGWFGAVFTRLVPDGHGNRPGSSRHPRRHPARRHAAGWMPKTLRAPRLRTREAPGHDNPAPAAQFSPAQSAKQQRAELYISWPAMFTYR